jgi:hypothetical protein
MNKFAEAAIVAGGIAVASAGMFFAPLAQAEPYLIPGMTVMTIVKWSGTDCITVRTATGQRDLCDSVQRPASEAVVEHGKAVGDLVGVDPVMGHAAWISCELYLNGSPYMGDTALAGDGSDVTCLRVLR